MYTLISDLHKHIREAVNIFENSEITKKADIKNIVITGLGGSGIGGTITSELCVEDCPVPIIVNKSYHLPAFVGKNTLLIACSYSGNTEETLIALAQGMENGAQIIAITSGGKLLEIARQNGYDHIVIPGGNPPRSMLGYSLSVLSLLMAELGFGTPLAKENLLTAANLIENEQERIKLHAKELASKNKNLFPVTYASSGFAGVATRWRQQFNENSKLPGWDAEVPEMNHNELVGWAGGTNQICTYILRSTGDYGRNQRRVEISSEIIRKHTKHVYEIWTEGISKIEQTIYLIHLGDWISYYLSEEHQVDIFDIKVIDHLKSELSKI